MKNKNIIKPVSFNTKKDKEMLEYISDKSFTAYVKKLIYNDMEYKDINYSDILKVLLKLLDKENIKDIKIDNIKQEKNINNTDTKSNVESFYDNKNALKSLENFVNLNKK